MSTARRLGVRAAVVDGSVVDGDVEVADGVITAVGIGGPGGSGLACPGFVDLQVNGFAGVDLLEASVEEITDVAVALARTGVTAFQPTLVTAAVDASTGALRRLADTAARPHSAAARILPAHLEGPFLAPTRAGAHDRSLLLAPDVAVLAALVAAGPVGQVTLAPELPRALDLVRRLVARDVLVSAGHSAASAAEAEAGFAAGIRSVTHLFNAMPEVRGRAPGLAGAAMANPAVTVQVIVDGVHLDDVAVRLAWAACGPDRLVVVTDAVAAAGLDDGEHRLGGRTVVRRGPSVHLGDGTLAGSCQSLDGSLRRLVDLGIPLAQAVGTVTTNPARLLRRDDLGRLRPGAPADVTVLDDDLAVRAVYVDGVPVE